MGDNILVHQMDFHKNGILFHNLPLFQCHILYRLHIEILYMLNRD